MIFFVLSDRTLNIVDYIKVYRYPYDFVIIPSSPVFRPGIPFMIELVLKDHNGLPVTEKEPSIVEMIADFELSDSIDTQNIMVELNQMGEGSVTFKPLINARQLRIKVCLQGHSRYTNLIMHSKR